MEKRVDIIVFRRMTYADFYNINKEGGEEEGGGGQSYFDIPLNKVSIVDWTDFIGPNTGNAAKGPYWKFDVNSLGLTEPIELKIYQRAQTRCAVASQKLPEHSRSGKRVPSWHPNNSFPIDYNPDVDNLVVYIIKSTDGDFWAGWFLKNEIPSNWNINDELKELFEEESAGIITVQSKILFDTENKDWPFYFDAQTIVNQIKTDEDVEEDLLNQDTSPKLAELDDEGVDPEVKERIFKIRKRNNKIVKELKMLYGGKCQITGERMTFKKKNGELYSEVHHLIPLGESGSDSYANAIVISPLIHRMLHYADVSEIDLNNIVDNKLKITINGDEYEITWLPQHLETVQKSLED
jgi:5-methylcytosine-specific restriction protein A